MSSNDVELFTYPQIIGGLNGAHCCYLLESQHPERPGKSYIGYTTDPRRRVREHNGDLTGGASKTAKWRPWEMLLFVSGFSDHNSALIFEEIWTYYKEKPYFRDFLPSSFAKKGRDFTSKRSIYILQLLLQIEPFRRIPLKICILNEQKVFDLSFGGKIGISGFHEIFVFSGIFSEKLLIFPPKQKTAEEKIQKVIKKAKDENFFKSLSLISVETCFFCGENLEIFENCWCPECSVSSHFSCLAEHFLRENNSSKITDSQLIPNSGKCPQCRSLVTWSKIVALANENYTLIREQCLEISRNKKKSINEILCLEEDNELNELSDEMENMTMSPIFKKVVPEEEPESSDSSEIISISFSD